MFVRNNKLEPLFLEQVKFSSLKGFQKDDLTDFRQAFALSCSKLTTINKDRPVNFGKFYQAGTYNDWQNACMAVNFTSKPLSNKNYRRKLLQNFKLYRAYTTSTDSGMLTGYYEPDIKGSISPDHKYKYPIYGIPHDLNGKPTYFSRGEIENGALSKHQAEIVWVDDHVELFFMHIQGSGRIHLDNGNIMRIGYAKHNGHGFTPIGRIMLEKQLINKNQLNAGAIKRWLRSNPEFAQEIMNNNASYVFFRQVNAIHGPIGAQGVELTANRSLAVDRRYYPLGIPAWIETKLPDSGYGVGKDYNRMMVIQDTGSAIKGAVRGDFFFGNGKKAEELAGNMKSKFKIFILIPRNVELKNI